MRVLFIGGTGNLSRECSLEALRSGIELWHLNRGLRSAVPERVRSLVADIRDPEAVRAALGSMRFDAVVDFICFEAKELAARLDLFRGRTGQYVFISSTSVYRKPPAHHVLAESTPLGNPFWAYARGKIECERLLTLRAPEAVGTRKDGPDWTIVRPGHTYGRGWVPLPAGSADFTMAARMLAGKELIVPGDGQALWTLTHSKDFAVGLVGLLGNQAALGEAVQIAGSEACTWDSVHRTVAAILGVEAKLVHVPSDFVAAIDPGLGEKFLGDKMYSSLYDSSKLKRLVPAFRSTVPLHEGLRDSLEWLLADPARQVVNAALDAAVEKVLGAWKAAFAAGVAWAGVPLE